MRTQITYKLSTVKKTLVLDFSIQEGLVVIFDQVYSKDKKTLLAKFKQALKKNKVPFPKNINKVLEVA